MRQTRLIGRVVVAWSKLEAAMHELVWAFVGIDVESGRILTDRQDSARLVIMLRALCDLYRDLQNDEERSHLLEVLNIIEQRRVDRNAIAHGAWATLDGKPIAASLRYRTDDLSEVITEEYSTERMYAIEADIIRCMINLDQAAMRLSASQDNERTAYFFHLFRNLFGRASLSSTTKRGGRITTHCVYLCHKIPLAITKGVPSVE
jgi:hypothetical protein